MLIKEQFLSPTAGTCAGQHAHPRTLLEELQARILAKVGYGMESDAIATHIAASMSSQTDEPRISAMSATSDPRASGSSAG